MSLNRVVVIGRIGKDPELRHTQSGTAVVSFNLAVDRDFKDKQTGEKVTDWISVTAWRSTAEFISRYFGKGRMIVVDGRLQVREWTDNDGNKHTVTEVVAENVYFGDSKRSDGQNGSGGSSYGGYQKPAYTPRAEPQEAGFVELPDDGDNLPF